MIGASHCYFVGNCVGERNRKHFIYFLIFATLFIIYSYFVILFILAFMAFGENQDYFRRIRETYWVTIISFAVLLSSCCLVPMMTYFIKIFLIFLSGAALVFWAVSSVDLELWWYEMPVVYCLKLLVGLPYLGWVTGNCLNQLFLASNGVI